MRLYVVVGSLFIYSALLVSDVVSKTRLATSPNPVEMACDRTARLPFSPLFRSSLPLMICILRVTHSFAPPTHSVRDAMIKKKKDQL